MTLSVLILTLNEAVNIGDCIASLPWREDIHVLDSGSSDSTVEIAIAMGAHVTLNPLKNYADQRNLGLALSFANEWIVMLDADERMTPELAREIEQVVIAAGTGLSMLRVRRKDMFMGRWLRRSSGYPTYFPRVFRRGTVTVKRDINEEYEARGAVRQLEGHLNHFPFKKGIDWWFERHNYYSALEAKVITSERKYRMFHISDITSCDPGRRRQAMKQLAYRLPFRPFLVFAYLYIIRLGFLDGRPGYHYASMRMAYEIMIDAKIALLIMEQ